MIQAQFDQTDQTDQTEMNGGVKPRIVKKPSSIKKQKVSRHRRPEGMSLEEWQIELRRQFGQTQNYILKAIDINEKKGFKFQVKNSDSGGDYQVFIRGKNPGDNHCSCPDFSINTLQTCKHIEFVIRKLGRSRKYRKIFLKKSSANIHFSHPMITVRHGSKREIYLKKGDQASPEFLLLEKQYFDENGILHPEKYSSFDQFFKKAKSLDPHFFCQEEALSLAAQVRDQITLKNRVQNLFPEGIESPKFKTLLKTELYPYQREGALFAAQTGRSIIADDMGLGKTLEAIAASEILEHSMGIERVLIVCPTSLKHQWKQEIEKFTHRSVTVVEGLLAVRQRSYLAPSFFKVVNYDVIHRDLDFIHTWKPDLIILDEAQRIKNWKTRTAKNVKKLTSPYTIVLTGTPLENRLEELHSIIEYVDRFRLGPSFRFLAEHQKLDPDGKVIGYHQLSKISETLKPVLLRRTKATVLKQLPSRLDKNLFLPITPEQWKHHVENAEIVGLIVSKWRRMGFLTEIDQRRLMIALQNMRMSCNSTYLLDGKTDFGTKVDELMTFLSETFEEKNIKVVVFSQWVKTHELIERRLKSKKWGHVFLHGGLSSKKRKEIISQFKETENCRLFLSTDAGGIGLNLQNASVVVNMDQPWNPAVLEQRVGRVHRLGQKNPVRVINFISEGTIEHGMLNLLAFKRSLFSGVLDQGQDEVFMGGSKLKKFMESVENISNTIPKTSQSFEAVSTKEPITQATNFLGILEAGASLIDQLTKVLSKEGPHQKMILPASLFSGISIEKDATSQKEVLKIAMPKPETIQKFAGLLVQFGQALSRI